MKFLRALFLGGSGIAVVAAAALGGTPVAAGRSPSAGAVLFHEKGCEHCHGLNGVGGERGPDLRGVGRRLTQQQIMTQIRDGGKNMPAFGEAIDESELKVLSADLAKRRAKSKAR